MALGVGFFNNSERLEDLFYGGAANMGGVVDGNIADGPLKPPRRIAAFTVPEMRWAMERLREPAAALQLAQPNAMAENGPSGAQHIGDVTAPGLPIPGLSTASHPHTSTPNRQATARSTITCMPSSSTTTW